MKRVERDLAWWYSVITGLLPQQGADNKAATLEPALSLQGQVAD